MIRMSGTHGRQTNPLHDLEDHGFSILKINEWPSRETINHGAITRRAPNGMTGSIKNLNPVNRSGFITADDGQTVYFGASAVWEHDYPLLAVGQAVSFDLLDGERPMALNVHLFEGRHVQLQPRKPNGPVELRFVRFDQANSIRTFHFQACVAGKETRDYSVTADVTLFGKHRIGIQEGPALCSRLVMAGLASSLTETASLALTEKDILAHVESRRVPKRRVPKRKRFRGPGPGRSFDPPRKPI
jgi:cold shock CspA family protein